MKIDSVNIGIITFPIERSGVVPLKNLLTILLEIIGGEVYLISGNSADELNLKNSRVHIRCLYHEKGGGMLPRLKNHLVTQIKITCNMLLIRRNIDIWFFYFGSELLILPFIVGKLTRKSVLLYLPNSCINDAKAGGSKLYPVIKLVSNFNCRLADIILVGSEDLIHTFGLTKYVEKIRIAHEYYADSAQFKTIRGIEDRENVVGFVGRLSEVKGILNFVQAMPLILDRNPEITFFIGGDGLCKDHLREYIIKHDLSHKVTFGGWINHDDLPDYLNILKLLVIPSYSEAGPIIAYEAMACGTPVLGTRVGCVLMSLNDGVSGYLLRDNSPKCIAENVVRVLNSPDLEQIAENGRRFVEENYTFQATVSRWRRVLEGI